MSKTVLVKVGDFVKKEDSGLVTKVESITVNKRNRLRSIVRLVGPNFEVEISGATRKDFKASLQGYELVEVNPSAKSAQLEEAHRVLEAAVLLKSDARAPVAPHVEEEACSWKPGDLVEHGSGERFRVLSVGLRPGETPEPRCLIELQHLATSAKSKTDAPVIDGVMAIDGFKLVDEELEREEAALGTSLDVDVPAAAPADPITNPAAFTPRLEAVTRSFARAVASTVKKGTLTPIEMLDVLAGLTAQVALQAGHTPGDVGDLVQANAAELVKMQAAEGRAS